MVTHNYERCYIFAHCTIFPKQIGEMMKEVSEDLLKQIEDVLNVIDHSLQSSEGQMRLMHTNDMLKLVLESNMYQINMQVTSNKK